MFHCLFVFKSLWHSCKAATNSAGNHQLQFLQKKEKMKFIKQCLFHDKMGTKRLI